MKNNFIKFVLLILCIFAIGCKENEKHTHVAGSIVKENIVNATANSKGSYEEVIYCELCGEELSRVKKETDEHTHVASSIVKENEVEATINSKGSYDEVTYCAICNLEMSRKTIITDKKAHAHKESEVVLENMIKPERVSINDAGSYEEVIYCELCGEVISRKKINNYYHQFDYLELSSSVNNLDNLTPLGNGKYLLNAKTNQGKEVRLLIYGEIEKIDNGWGSISSETKIYSLDALPGINYLEQNIDYENSYEELGFFRALYNFEQKQSVDSENDLYELIGENIQSSSRINDLTYYSDYFLLQNYDGNMNIYDMKIYYCNVLTQVVDVDINYSLTEAYIPGEKFKDSEDFYLNVLISNPACDYINDHWIPIANRDLVPFGNIITSDGSICNREDRILAKGDKLEVKIDNKIYYLDLCVDTFVGEKLDETIDTQIINSIGTQNVLVVPFTFTDQVDRLTNEAMNDIKQALGNVMNSDGNITTYKPKNGVLSLSEYIYTSSYGKLTINSYITDPYVLEGNGTDYFDKELIDYLGYVEEWLKSKNDIDLSKFDQNGDGYYDIVIFINTLDIDKDSDIGTYYRVGMSGAFRGTRTYYKELAGTNEKPNINCYLNVPNFFLYDDYIEKNELSPNTLFHEFGHALGLIDYYDVSESQINTIGMFDMQSHNLGDWNSYSKYALGWIDPIIIDGKEDEYTITLSPYSLTGNAILIPSLNYDYNGTPFDEYIMIELFANDGLYKVDSLEFELQNSVGVKIYHINSVYEKRTYENSDGSLGVIGTVHHTNSLSTRYFDEGKFLIELVQKGNVNTFATIGERSSISSEDLFYENDVFTVESYDNFFYSGLMDDGSEFGYKITIEKIVNDGENSLATIKIEKQ